MRNLTKYLVVIAILSVVAASLVFAGEGHWFDMEKCTMCKPLTEQPGLMENMTWEQHNISNGVISVTTVGKEYVPAYKKAQAEMHGVQKKLQKGEQVELCGMCNAVGQLMMKGVKSEYVDTRHGDVWIMTADNPELIAEIQGWAKRTNEEMKKMEAAAKAEKS